VVRPSVCTVEDRRGRRARCGGSCCTTSTAGKRKEGERSRDQNSEDLNERTVREGAYEGSLLWENGIEHLQDLMLGKFCAEGIVHPGGLRERGIEKGTHVPYARAVSGVVDDGVGKEGECWVVWRPVFQWRRRGGGSVVVRPGNPFVTFWELVVGPGKVGLSRDR